MSLILDIYIVFSLKFNILSNLFYEKGMWVIWILKLIMMSISIIVFNFCSFLFIERKSGEKYVLIFLLFYFCNLLLWLRCKGLMGFKVVLFCRLGNYWLVFVVLIWKLGVCNVKIFYRLNYEL